MFFQFWLLCHDMIVWIFSAYLHHRRERPYLVMNNTTLSAKDKRHIRVCGLCQQGGYCEPRANLPRGGKLPPGGARTAASRCPVWPCPHNTQQLFFKLGTFQKRKASTNGVRLQNTTPQKQYTSFQLPTTKQPKIQVTNRRHHQNP